MYIRMLLLCKLHYADLPCCSQAVQTPCAMRAFCRFLSAEVGRLA